MINNKYLIAILIVCTAVIFFSSCYMLTTPAEENRYEAVDGNIISQERLDDDVIEYDELGTLVHVGNPDVKEMTDATEKNREEYTEIRDYLLLEARSAGEAEETATYRMGVKTYNNMIKSLDTYSSTLNQVTTEKQLVYAAQSLMISYESMSGQKEYYTKMEQLYSKLYSQMQLKQQSGMATVQEAEAVRNTWLSMQAACVSIDESEYSVVQSLYQILGIQNEGVTIAKIPAVDISRVDALDLEADTKTALGNNLDLSEARKSSSGKTTSSIAKKERTVDEIEQEIKISMEELYQKVQQAKISYQAAQTGMAGAGISWDLAEKKYQLGMLNETDYLQAEIFYLDKQNEFNSAELSLLQAIETYDWAMNGIM